MRISQRKARIPTRSEAGKGQIGSATSAQTGLSVGAELLCVTADKIDPDPASLANQTEHFESLQSVCFTGQ